MATSLVPKIGAVGTLAQLSTDASGNTVLVGADGANFNIGQHRNSVVAFLGDSFASNCGDLLTAPHYNASIEGGFRTALAYTGFDGTFESHGVGGETSTQIAARKDEVAANIVVVYAGTNDINNATSSGDITAVLTTLKANLAEIWDYLRNQGKTVIATTIAPFGTTGGLSVAGWSANQLTMQIEANRWIREQAYQRGMRVFEQFIPLVDPASAGMAPRLNMLRDGVHLSSQGSLEAARYNAKWIQEDFGTITPTIGSVNDLSTFQNGGVSNLVNNPAMIAGTGGMATVGSGTINGSAVNVSPDALIPQGWRVFNVAGTQAVATKIVPNPSDAMARGAWTSGEYYGAGDYAHDTGILYRAVVTHLAGATLAGDILKWEVVTPAGYATEFTITGADATTHVQLYPASHDASARIVSGRYLSIEAVVDVVSSTNMYPPQLKLDMTFASAVSGYTNWTTNWGTSGSASTLRPMNQRGRFLLRSPKVYVDPAGGAISSSQIYLLGFKFSGAGDAVVRVSQPRLLQTA